MWIAKYVFLLSIVIFINGSSAQTSATNYSNCATNLGTLERALYETEGNLFHLNEIFYPPSLLPTRFIKVNYTFINDEDSSMTCTNVTYVWAVGEILFLQPPTLFKLHSLFFYFPNNELTVLDLTLPYECLPLITAKDHECSCSNDSVMLDVLTQQLVINRTAPQLVSCCQLKGLYNNLLVRYSIMLVAMLLLMQLNIYAKFTSQDNIQRSNTFARAVCGRELFDTYYSGRSTDHTYIIVAATIVGPFLLLLLLTLAAILSCCVKKSSGDFTFKSIKEKRLIALIVIGILVTIYIFILDILAANIIRNSHHEYAKEYEQYMKDNANKIPVNLWVTYWTLACDIIFIIFFIFYIIVKFMKKNGIKTCFRRNKCQVPLPLDLLLLTPIACLISHLGYIMLAWLTEPSRSTTTLILYYFIFFYLFITIRKSYKVVDKLCCKGVEEEVATGDSNNNSNGSTAQNKGIPRDRKLLVSVLLSTILGLLYLGIAVVFIMIVYLVPLASEELFDYLFNVIQFMIIVISTQFAYKLLAKKKFSLKRIVKTMKREIETKHEQYKDIDCMAKATGMLLANDLIHPHIENLKGTSSPDSQKQANRGTPQKGGVALCKEEDKAVKKMPQAPGNARKNVNEIKFPLIEMEGGDKEMKQESDKESEASDL